MKIAVIGGGSTYTPELVNGFLDRINSLPVSELWLMDIDEPRLEIVGGFAQRMVEAKGLSSAAMLRLELFRRNISSLSPMQSTKHSMKVFGTDAR